MTSPAPPPAQTPAKPTAPERPKAVKGLMVCAVLTLVLGAVALGTGMALFFTLNLAILWWGVGAALVVWWLLVPVILLATRSWTQSTAFQLMLMGAVGPAILGAGLLVIANGLFDPHPPVQQEVVILEKETIGSRSSSDQTFHLVVEDWRAGREGKTYTFERPEPELFHRVRQGDKLIIDGGPGLVGWWYRELIPVRASR